MGERRVKVVSEVGLHARPAALFVQEATRASGGVTVARPGHDPVNAKSILSVLGLDVRHEEEVVITAEGEDAVIDRLAALVESPESEPHR